MQILCLGEQKDSGLILAARFCLLTEDYEKAYRLSESIASSIKEYKHATSIEQEAVCVFHWASFHLHVDAIKRQKQIQKLHLLIDDCFNVVEPDLITCFAHCYLSIGKFDEAVGILNKVL